MTDHWAAIGLQVPNQERFMALARAVVGVSEEVFCTQGSYCVWRDPEGPQLWAQFDEERAFVGMNPYFDGASRVRLGVVRQWTREGETTLDGCWYAWVEPQDAEDMTSGMYPLCVDLPDAGMCDVEEGTIITAQLVGFAHDGFQIYADEAAFGASQEGDEVKFAAKSLIPVGLFTEGDAEPGAYARLSGTVVKARQQANAFSRGTYWWALVETLGGRFDVVIPESLVPDGALREGGVVCGICWVTGRVLDDG